MIIPEDSAASPPKGHDQLPEAPISAPPPAYNEHPPLDPALVASTSHTTPRPTASIPIYVPTSALFPPRHTESAGVRFFKAWAVAILVWALFAIAVDSLVEATWQHHPRRWNKPNDGGQWQDVPDGHPGGPQRQDGELLNCTKYPMDWLHEGGHPVTSFDLPLDSDALYVFSRGLKAAGSIVITQDEREHDPHSVHFDIAAVHSTPSFLDYVSVCALERRRSQRGIGIFTPNNGRIPTLDFEITVRLPKLGDRNHLELNAFETRLPMFTHQIGDLGEHVHFQSLDLQSQYASMSSQSVNATKLRVLTTNAPIRGTYQAMDSLRLSTNNGVIDAHVTMQAEDEDASSEATLETSNAAITSRFNLVVAGADKEGGTYKIKTTTANGRIALGFDHSPLDSRLDLIARTTNAPVRVTLDPSYEGSFEARTYNAVAKVDWNRTDPTGLNRERQILSSASSLGHVKGSVAWDREHMGRVDVRTQNGPITLHG